MKAKRMKKKILFINGNLNMGGVERSLVSILNSIDYSKYDIDLLLLESSGELKKELPAEVRVIIRSLDSAYGPLINVITGCLKKRDIFSLSVRFTLLLEKFIGKSAYRIFKSILKLEKYDTCIGFRTGMPTDLAIYGIKADRKIIWWHHGEINVQDTYSNTAKKCDCLVTVSKYCKQMISDKFPNLEQKIVVIPNMIDVDSLNKLAVSYKPPFTSERVNIVSVGRLSPEKRYDLAVASAKYLKQHGYEFEWYLIGDGSELPKLKSEVEKSNLNDMFHFVGELSNPYPYMINADVFAHPSYVESQGIAVLEALTLSVPVVVMETGGLPEFVLNNQNGFLCKKYTVDFFRRIELMVSDKVYRECLRKKADLPEEYKTEIVISEIERII